MNDQNLKPFTKEYRPKNPGRKPSHLKKWIKENNICVQDIQTILGGILVKIKTEEELKELLTNKETPMLVSLFVSAMLKDKLYGRTNTLQFLLRYAYGEPKQTIEADVSFVDIPAEKRWDLINSYIARRISEAKINEPENGKTEVVGDTRPDQS